MSTAFDFEREFSRALAEEEAASEATKRIREAAPDLLAALKDCIAHLGGLAARDNIPNSAIEAIAKAEGRS